MCLTCTVYTHREQQKKRTVAYFEPAPMGTGIYDTNTYLPGHTHATYPCVIGRANPINPGYDYRGQLPSHMHHQLVCRNHGHAVAGLPRTFYPTTSTLSSIPPIAPRISPHLLPNHHRPTINHVAKTAPSSNASNGSSSSSAPTSTSTSTTREGEKRKSFQMLFPNGEIVEGFQFLNDGRVSRYKETHLFECGICQKIVGKKSNLRIHCRVHTTMVKSFFFLYFGGRLCTRLRCENVPFFPS